MTIAKSSVRYVSGALVVIILTFGLFASFAIAQSAGNNVVCKSTVGCTTSSEWSPSTAFVDAYGIDSGTNDICKKINEALQYLQTSSPIGGVVDARGLNSSNTNMTCASGTTPWYQTSPTITFTTAPAEILLPAGTICIQSTWVIPDRTRVFGVSTWASGGIYGTYIYAVNSAQRPAACASGSSFSGTEMIDLGYVGTPTNYPSAPCPNSPCSDVAVDGLTLDGSALDIFGIVNKNSDGLSYANQLTMREFLGTSTAPVSALAGSAIGAAPYSNLQIGSGSDTDNDYTECVELSQTSGVSGVHGMTCTGSSTALGTGILLAGSSNSVEDVHFEGVYGAVVAAAPGNLLLNVEGATSSIGTGTYSAYICNSGSSFPCPTGAAEAINTAVLGISSSASQLDTLYDDVTKTTLTHINDPSVALYVLGGPVPSTSTTNFSRFNTSPRYPTWSAGTSTPTASSSCTSPGSVFSNAAATYMSGTPNTIWVCVGSTWIALE